MERIMGSVVEGDRVIVPTAAAWVEVATSTGGRAEWFGHLDLPAGADLMSKGYEFRADDGRIGRMRILWCLSKGGRSTRAEFRGAGPFR